MPTLFRFLLVVAVLAGLGFAAMFALATFVEPEPREITVPVPTKPHARRLHERRAPRQPFPRHARRRARRLQEHARRLPARPRRLSGLSRPRPARQPDKAAAATVRGFMASLEERGLKASSAARRLSAVRQFHKFLYVEGYAPADPTAAVSAPKRGRALPKVLSVDEVDRLLQVAYEGIQHARGLAGRAPARGPHGLPAGTPLRHRPARLGARRAAAQRRQDPRPLSRGARQGRQGAARPAHRGGAGRGAGLSRASGGAGARPPAPGCSRPTARAAISPARPSPAT